MERYVHGHHGSVVSNHARRTAADSAGFLLERLRPDMDLLDVGCGPGSISIDLASRVRSVTGVDASTEAITHAVAAADGVANVRFAPADVYRLPFDDSSFDVVFAHQVLQHLGRPVDALVEMGRVLVPGGLVAVRDADYGTMVFDPPDHRLDRWLALYRQVARRLGGEPDAGRKLAGWVASAGFTDLEVSAGTWVYATCDEVRAWAELWVSRLLEARLGESLLDLGMADRPVLEDLATAWRDWASASTPFFAFLHGQVLARA